MACNIAYITKIDIDILYNITARTHTREIGKPGVLMGTHDPISFMPAGAGYCTENADKSELQSDRTGTPVPIAISNMQHAFAAPLGGYAPPRPPERLLRCARRHLASQ